MRKFLIGCGVVMGVLLLISIVGTWVLVDQLKDELPNLKQMEAQQEELAAQYGAIDEFIAPLDGRVDPARMETYLRVRAQLPSDDTEFLRAITGVAEQEKKVGEAKGLDKIKEAYRVAKQGMGVARVAVEYLARRDSVLLAEGMGPGEYVHLTALGPILLLDHQPERCAPELGDRLSEQDSENLGRAHEHMLRLFRDQMENTHRALRGKEDRSEAEDAYLAELDREFERGRIGDAATPFASGLPTMTEESLAPYADRLRNGLPRCRETWALELLVAVDENDSGIQVQWDSDGDD